MTPEEIADAKARAKARVLAERAFSKEHKGGAPQPEPSLGQKIMQGAAGGLSGGIPGAVAGAVGAYNDEATKALERGAYKAGGAVSDFASKGGASPEVAGGLGFAANVGIQAIPAVAGAVSGKGLAGPSKDLSKKLMQSAIKPTLANLKNGNAARAIDTMLEKGINATEGGLSKLRNEIARLNGEISTAIQNSRATVSKGEVGKSLIDTYNKFKKQVNPKSDLDAIKKAWMEFRDHPALRGSQDIPVQLAQEMKQGTYKQVAKKYGQLSAADDEAQKALARGLKDEIAKAVPGISRLNKEESELLNALNVSERRILMGLNNNPAGLSLLAGNKAAAAAFMADKSALFKSLAARMIYQGADPLSTGLGASAGAVVSGSTQN